MTAVYVIAVYILVMAVLLYMFFKWAKKKILGLVYTLKINYLKARYDRNKEN